MVILVSRDRQDSADLATLLKTSLQSDEMRSAVVGLLGLAIAPPHVAAVTAGIGAAGVLGDFAYRLLGAVTGNTIGLYRNSHLKHSDGFGVGRDLRAGAPDTPSAEFSNFLTDLGLMRLHRGRPADAIGPLRRALELREAAPDEAAPRRATRRRTWRPRASRPQTSPRPAGSTACARPPAGGPDRPVRPGGLRRRCRSSSA